MPVYSDSRLSTYEQCPFKYKLHYRDRIKRDTEGVEAFLGSMVHETLRKCYDDLRFTKLNSLSDLIAYYGEIWQKDWRDSIVVTREGLTREHYKALGEKLIGTYYNRYAPFDQDTTISTEMRVNFSLDDENKYRMTGYIDRLSRTRDGVYEIHDYKTSATLPTQENVDNDRQLGLYHIGVQKKWADAKNIRLVWHYVAFDAELASSRSEEAILNLIQDTRSLIDKVEAAEDFPARESALCDWCEYTDLCPLRKHFHAVEALPSNEYLNEPGVALVDKYAALKSEEAKVKEEMNRVKEAIIAYVKKEGIEVVRGSDHKIRVKIGKELKFPRKGEEERVELEKVIEGANRWMEVSQLDIRLLSHVVESGSWNKDLIEKVMKYGLIEESSSVHMSKLKEEER